jgi:tetratricopeptide (TPR) repeat protein
MLVVALLFCAAAPAAASEDARAREARTACLAGDYTRGVTILSELFVNTQVSTYIYNQGRCFEQNARYREAISRFQEYLRIAKDAPGNARAEAEKHIADCRTLLAQESPAPTLTSTPVTPSSPAVASVSQPAAPQPPQPASETGSGLRTAGIVIAAVGGAALVTGVVLNLKANSMASDYETFNGYTKQKESQRKSYETSGWVSYGAAAACLTSGALLYYLGARANKDGSPSVAVLPSRDGAVFVARGSL